MRRRNSGPRGARPDGDRIFRAIVRSPWGPLVLEATDLAVVRLSFEGRGRTTPSNRLLDRARRELREYFAGRRRVFTVPVKPEGTAFQRKVWRALRRIPYGRTAGYGEIARKVGRPRASRAVGQACGANPVAIVIPCHRVIGRDGSLTGFGGGMRRKKALLSLEGATS